MYKYRVCFKGAGSVRDVTVLTRSVPTVRASELATAPPAVPPPLPPDRIAPPRPPFPAPIAVLVVSRELMPLQPASPASTTRTNPPLPSVRRDRKSTRLNYSH